MKNKQSSFSNRLTKIYKKWYIGLLISVVIATLVFLFYSTDMGKGLEWKTLDYRFRKFPIPDKADTNIVLIAIDNNSLNFFSANGISWPWPRDFYAHIVDYLTTAGTKAVIFDMLFYEPDLNRDETDAEETDGAFAQAIKSNGKVILAAELTVNIFDSISDISSFALPFKQNIKSVHSPYLGGKIPIDTLRKASHSLGLINIIPDNDGIFRRISMVYEFENNYYPQMAFGAWLINNNKLTIKRSKRSITIGQNSIPVDSHGKYLVNWYGSGGTDGVFRYLPFSAVIQSASAMQAGLTPSLSPETFKNKYIIIGSTASGLLFDFRPTPFAQAYPGMEIWATILSNLINKDFIFIIPWWLNFINVVFVAFFTFFIFTRLTPKFSNPLLIIVIIYISGSAIYLWSAHRILVNITMPLTGFILSYFYTATVSYLMEGRSKREIRKVFTRYLHPGVIQNLLEDPNSIKVGGDSVTATVLFSDIYNFTNFSEGKSAIDLVQYLNEYFEKLTQIILAHNGLLDKYTGDGIMAIFGVPVHREDHAVMACKAALAHRNFSLSLIKTGEKLSSASNFHLNTRIGMNSGPIVVGNIGSRLRMDYTAIGDDVNLAARLEGVNKIFKTHIIISQSTYELASDNFICRELDCLRVKGKKEPTKIYELIDEKGAGLSNKYNWIEQYHNGLQLYREGDWEKAISLFKELSESPQKDNASKVMLDRCIYYMKNPPKKWDGILTLEVK